MRKELRVRKNEEFASIIGMKHSVSSAGFVVFYAKRAQDHARVGISVSKKLGNAVMRNKIKRQMREMIRSLIDFNEYPLDLIIIARKPYLTRDFEANKNDLEIVIKKAII